MTLPSMARGTAVGRRDFRLRMGCAWSLVGCLALPAAGWARSLVDLPLGTGYAAWELCTRTIVSGDDYQRVLTDYTEPKVPPLPFIWRIHAVPKDKFEVKTWLPGVPDYRAAIYRPGQGCTLVTPDTTEAAVRAQPFTPLVVAPPVMNQPWPHGEGAPEASALSAAHTAVIARHARAMFSEPRTEPTAKLHTIAVLVAKDGKLMHEQYRSGYERRQPQLGWSMTKTLTSLIAGLQHRDGRLKLDEPVGLSEWQGTPKAAITWRQVLNHAPGLSWDEGYGGDSDATRMLFNHADQGLYAARLPLVSKPGTAFIYSTGFSNIAMLGLKRMAGGTHQAIHDYYQQRLFAPLGIQGGVIEPDASGTPVGGARGVLRPVDWLKLGQLVAQGGVWKRQALIAPDYMAFLTAASPASGEYGASIWRLHGNNVPAAVRGRLPADTVWFSGHMAQHMVVVPSRNLVVLRMGVAFDKDLAKTQVFSLVADLLEAK